MKAKIYSFIKLREGSKAITASLGIMRFVADQLGIECLWDTDIADEQLDVLIIVNGAYAFAGNERLEALSEAIMAAKRIVWVQNDFTIIPPKHESKAMSPFRKAFRDRHIEGKAPVDFWTTVKMMSSPGLTKSKHLAGPNSEYFNWNALTTTDEPANHTEGDYPGHLVYYGAFRQMRAEYFHRYLHKPKVPAVISTPISASGKKFIGYEATLIDTVTNLHSFLSRNGGMGLYLEDKRSHKEYHSPANRFYEMLSAGMPMVFQPEAWTTLKTAGYPISGFYAEPRQLEEMMDKRDEIGKKQRELWWDRALAEKNVLPEQLKRAYSRLLEGL